MIKGMTEQTKQKLKDALIEHKNIAASEYDDEDAFVGIYFSDLVDIIDSFMNNTGWHPASELPQLDKNGGSDLVYALGKVFSKEFGEYIDKVPCRVRVIHGKWAPEDIEVEWWCYPPKEN